MHVKWKAGPISFDAFCAIVNDGEKADLIDGIIYMASPDSWENSTLQNWLSTLISIYVSDFDLGQVVGSRTAFRLDPKSGPEPDIAFVQASRLKLAQRGYFEGPPDLAIEIVSPDSVDRDYVVKRKKYRSAGVREYWIIDPRQKKLTLLRLDKNGRFRVVRPRGHIYYSDVLPMFWFESQWFWRDPLPKVSEIYRLITT